MLITYTLIIYEINIRILAHILKKKKIYILTPTLTIIRTEMEPHVEKRDPTEIENSLLFYNRNKP